MKRYTYAMSYNNMYLFTRSLDEILERGFANHRGLSEEIASDKIRVHSCDKEGTWLETILGVLWPENINIFLSSRGIIVNAGAVTIDCDRVEWDDYEMRCFIREREIVHISR